MSISAGSARRRVAADNFARWLSALHYFPDQPGIGGQCPRTMRTGLVCIRYFPDPPGIVTAVAVGVHLKAPLAKGGCLGTAEAGG